MGLLLSDLEHEKFIPPWQQSIWSNKYEQGQHLTLCSWDISYSPNALLGENLKGCGQHTYINITIHILLGTYCYASYF